MSSASSPTDRTEPVEPVATPDVLHLDGVSLRYGDVVALHDVSLRVRAGERVAVLGPSGAGKSSLISLANTSRRPAAGIIRLLGENVTDLNPSQRTALRRRVGTVHQQPPLPGALRVVHNVNAGRLGNWSTWRALSSLVRPREVERAREILDLLGIGHKVWRRTDELSGGERQRVALARVMVQGAELLLADEPTANLDSARANEVLALLCGRRDGDGPGKDSLFESVVVCIHDVDLALAHFDRAVGLRRGRVMFDRPASEVTPALARRLYDLTGDR